MAMRRAWLAALPLVRSLSAPAISPVKFWALRYAYVEGMLEKRSPFRAAHLDGLRRAWRYIVGRHRRSSRVRTSCWWCPLSDVVPFFAGTTEVDNQRPPRTVV
mmetsp:Transcript_19613/g.78047  ORF Transcript_19613/g.78047 Transcript_19613/m.78047 type:complete len:103 (-) Transcript_19613:622-930(-)